MHVNGYPLVLMIFAIAAGGFCLALRKGARVISACAAMAAVLAVLAIPPWLDALASVFATGPGMVALVGLAVIGIAVFVVDHMRHHHPVRTTVFGIIGATAGVMAWAMAPELGAQGAKLGPKTAAALGQATRQIQSGHAASTMSGSSAMVTLAVGAVILFALGRFIHRHHKRRPFAGARAFGAVAALPAGSRPGAAPTGSAAAPGPGPRPPAGASKKRGFLARMTGG